jgi:hypothetical protein
LGEHISGLTEQQRQPTAKNDRRTYAMLLSETTRLRLEVRSPMSAGTVAAGFGTAPGNEGELIGA